MFFWLFYKDYLITGDIGYFDSENNLTIISRAKDILISNGKNYFTVDIENYLASNFQELVNRIIIVQIYDTDNSQKKNLCFLKGITNTNLYLEINKKLLLNYGFTISDFYNVEEFPRSKSGKLLRKKLVEQLVNRGRNKWVHKIY